MGSIEKERSPIDARRTCDLENQENCGLPSSLFVISRCRHGFARSVYHIRTFVVVVGRRPKFESLFRSSTVISQSGSSSSKGQSTHRKFRIAGNALIRTDNSYFRILKLDHAQRPLKFICYVAREGFLTRPPNCSRSAMCFRPGSHFHHTTALRVAGGRGTENFGSTPSGSLSGIH